MKYGNILKLVLATFLLCLGSGTYADEASDGMSHEASDDTLVEAGLIVNINEADAITIAKVLLNIGAKKAQAIVDYREKYGRFYSPEELSAVKGIGQRTIEKNEGRIVTQ